MSDVTNGARAAIMQLVAEGVEVVLGIPGAHNVYLCDAILDHPELRFICGRHEQDIGFVADGYARASGRLAVPIVISGPGVTNSLTALADAYSDSVPMLLLAAYPKQHFVGKGAFHELKDQTGLLASVTKWNERVSRMEEVPQAIRTAVAQAYSGRPGPTAIEIPYDVQAQEGRAEVVPPTPPERLAADPEAVRDAAGRLAASESPVVYLGARALDCAREATGLVERLRAPCLADGLSLGVVPGDHPLFVGWAEQPGAAEILADADAAVVVGSGLDEIETNGWTRRFPKELIHVDSDAAAIGRNYPASVGLPGDPKTVLAQLLVELAGTENRARPAAAARVAEIRQRALAAAGDKPIWPFIDAMARALPRDAFVTNDASATNGWVLSHVTRYLPRTMNITRSLAALGYALPGAIGAKIAHPDRQAVAVAGDGGFLFTGNALTTAVQYRLNVVAVVFNDGAYSSIRTIQEDLFSRCFGVDLHNPDFVGFAESHGAVGVRAEDPERFGDELLAAWRRDLPTVIEVPGSVWCDSS